MMFSCVFEDHYLKTSFSIIMELEIIEISTRSDLGADLATIRRGARRRVVLRSPWELRG